MFLRSKKMKPRNPSYIGITDFTDPEQVHRMRDVLDEVDSERMLGVGVMMSYKTLRGIETKWSRWFPPNEEVARIFVRRAGVFNVLHYADYDDTSGFAELSDALSWAGDNVDALQLDMIWPDPMMLGRLRQEHSFIKFIIQVNQKAIDLYDGDMDGVAQKLEEYYRAGCLGYALFDLSMGQGKAMDATRLMSYVWVATKYIPRLSVVVAGGLGPTSMDLLLPAIRDGNPLDVSIDAQGKLRPSGKADQEFVDWDMAAEYLRNAEALLQKYSS